MRGVLIKVAPNSKHHIAAPESEMVERQHRLAQVLADKDAARQQEALQAMFEREQADVGGGRVIAAVVEAVEQQGKQRSASGTPAAQVGMRGTWHGYCVAETDLEAAAWRHRSRHKQ